MNPSDWIKAVALVTQHKQEAATAESALWHTRACSNEYAYRYRCTCA